MSLPTKKKLTPVGTRFNKDRVVLGKSIIDDVELKATLNRAQLSKISRSNPHLSQTNEPFATIKLKQPTLDLIQSQNRRDITHSKLRTMDDVLTFHNFKCKPKQQLPYFDDSLTNKISGTDSLTYRMDTIPGGTESFLTSSLSYPLWKHDWQAKNENALSIASRELEGYYSRDLSSTLSSMKNLEMLSNPECPIARDTLHLASLPQESLDVSKLSHWDRLPKPKLRYGRTTFPDTTGNTEPIPEVHYSESARFLRKTLDRYNFENEVYKEDRAKTIRLLDSRLKKRRDVLEKVEESIWRMDDMARTRNIARDRSLRNQAVSYVDRVNKRDKYRKYNTVAVLLNSQIE